MNTKKWYLSITVWFNVALATVDFINALAPFIPFPAGFLTIIATVGNVLLRFKTQHKLI